MHPL
jgi:MFS family permease